MANEALKLVSSKPHLTTVVSYPERGKYGDNRWRGNCSGLLIKDLLEWYSPKKAFDPMVGSGTFVDVSKELGINHYALDLNPKFGGWDALNDEVPESADFIFWHPPYHTMIEYSGNMWGDAPDPRDLSRCGSWAEFIRKSDKVQAKLFSSLRQGGRMAILVGDYKQKGKLFSMMKDMSWIGSPEQVIIKTQHNCVSSQTKYSGKFIPITHEYVLIFKRNSGYVVPVRVVKQVDVDLRTRATLTWHDVVHAAMEALGGKANLNNLYREIEGHAKCATNTTWQAKVRQTLQKCKDFVSTERGKWAFNY